MVDRAGDELDAPILRPQIVALRSETRSSSAIKWQDRAGDELDAQILRPLASLRDALAELLLLGDLTIT